VCSALTFSLLLTETDHNISLTNSRDEGFVIVLRGELCVQIYNTVKRSREGEKEKDSIYI